MAVAAEGRGGGAGTADPGEEVAVADDCEDDEEDEDEDTVEGDEEDEDEGAEEPEEADEDEEESDGAVAGLSAREEEREKGVGEKEFGGETGGAGE